MISMKEAFAMAEANLKLEGMHLSPRAKAISERVCRGEISLEDGRQELLSSFMAVGYSRA